jgi:hypothetical protein
MAGRFGQHGGQHCAIAQVQMPIIGAGKADFICYDGAGLHKIHGTGHEIIT